MPVGDVSNLETFHFMPLFSSFQPLTFCPQLIMVTLWTVTVGAKPSESNRFFADIFFSAARLGPQTPFC
jgi:hypothetical protein